MTEPIDAEIDFEPDLLVESVEGVVKIVLNRPHRKNALTSDMVRSIGESVRQASSDDETRVVVITSSGPDFCSGFDLVQSNGPRGEATQKPRTGHLQRRLGAGAHDMILALDAAQVPIVAGVRGWAAGIGNMLALSADVVVADTTAKFWSPFVTRGFTPDSGTTWMLPRLIGLARAKEMVLRGRPVEGVRAAEWGLISECVEPGDLEASIADLTNEFAGGATVAIGLARTLLHQNISVTLPAALHNEAIHEELAIRSDDFKEGMSAFSERRPPNYTGR